ncbi:MAG: AmmeMemoRadiSam system protein B [Ignavibacteria bacterium]|nr:AmmeMemoRadiSam system protein B [Ignavibacteria bacterium]
MKIRKPAVAGRFYPGKKGELTEMIESILSKEKDNINLSLSKKKIIGGVVPHAGYMFSAYEAVHFFEIIKSSNIKYDTIFIINPNHIGLGAEIALDENDFWETPLGKTELDKQFMTCLPFKESSEAHKYEHSGEVMLPLLQYFLDYDFKIVPITITRQCYDNAKRIAKSVYEENKKMNRKILILASSDFSHYVPPEVGKMLDGLVIEQIKILNSKKIDEVVSKKNLSVCGFGAIMTLLEYAKLVSDNPTAEIIRAGNSGDIMPSDEVVDYITVLVYEN